MEEKETRKRVDIDFGVYQDIARLAGDARVSIPRLINGLLLEVARGETDGPWHGMGAKSQKRLQRQFEVYVTADSPNIAEKVQEGPKMTPPGFRAESRRAKFGRK